MKSKNNLDHYKNWNINYSTYIDDLRVFSDNVYKKPSNELLRKDFDRVTIVYERSTLKPLLIELKNASSKIGEVDNLSKEDIILKVIGFVDNHGRKE